MIYNSPMIVQPLSLNNSCCSSAWLWVSIFANLAPSRCLGQMCWLGWWEQQSGGHQVGGNCSISIHWWQECHPISLVSAIAMSKHRHAHIYKCNLVLDVGEMKASSYNKTSKWQPATELDLVPRPIYASCHIQSVSSCTLNILEEAKAITSLL